MLIFLKSFSKGVMKRPPISAAPGLDRRWSSPSASYCHGRWRLRGITAVSYTHLDVYKRQTYNKPLATSYTYIRFLDRKVQLPEKKNKVYHNGDIKSMSLADLYGKMAIEAQIIKMDVYHLPFLKISDFELFYNYLGSIEVN